MSIIFLTGMPASGKTYRAAQLSEVYKIPYADLDEQIELQAGKTISEIFETEGEQAFREMERDVLIRLIKQSDKPVIIACGGGTPVYADNMETMKSNGCVVYLRANIELLASRLKKEFIGKRPLLSGSDDLDDKLTAMLKVRKNIYEQAHYVIDAETDSITNFEQIIRSCIDPH